MRCARRAGILFRKITSVQKKGAENGSASDPADNSGRIYAGQAAGGVDENVTERGTSAGNEGLVPFVQTGKAHAKDSGGKNQLPAADPVNVQREGDRDGQQKVFRDMCGLSHIMLQKTRIMQDLLGVPSLIEELAAKFHQIRGDAAAQLPGNIAALRRKVEDEIHHHQRGKKGKRLEQIAEQLFQKQPEIFHK